MVGDICVRTDFMTGEHYGRGFEMGGAFCRDSCVGGTFFRGVLRLFFMKVEIVDFFLTRSDPIR